MVCKTFTRRWWHEAQVLPLLRILLIGVLTFGVHEAAYSQTAITGTVTSEDGEAVPGANVIIKGTTRGTTTDVDGRYSIEATPSDVLVFSFIGYVQEEIPVNNRSSIDVVLSTDTRQLEEVVVTAFGMEREKKALGYSVQELGGEALQEARDVNVVNQLKGKIAGVHINPTSGGPGSSSYIVIRGNSSLAGNNAPLVVVDGVPIDNSTYGGSDGFSGVDYGDGISSVNPDDIETISVLKGPSAAALYGARGATGVILITTKTGKKGKKGVGVDINSNATFETPNLMPTFQNTWGGGYDDNYLSFNTVNIDGQDVLQWPSWMNDQWGGRMDGRPMVFQFAPELGVVPYSPQPEDNIRNFYRTGSTFTNTVSVTGNGEKGSVRLSLSDLQAKHIVPNSSYDRQTVNLRAQYQVSEKLLVDAKVNYVRQGGKNRVQNGVSNTSVASSLNIIPRNIDLDWLKDHTREDGLMRNYKSGTPYNPYWLVEKFKNEDTRDRVTGMARLKYDIAPWLSIQGRTGTDFFTDNRFSIIPQGTPGSANINGQVTNDMWTAREDNHDVLLTADGNLSENFTGTLSLGASHQNRSYERLRVNGQNLNIPELYHISNAGVINTTNSINRRKMNSVYFMGQVGYKNVLYLELTGRNDWSSTLGTNEQSFFYPSVSTSFILTDAIELNSNVLSFAKLRASWAQAGTDASPYMTRGGYNIQSITNNYNGQRMATIQDRIPLFDLKNELATSVEFGTDMRFFNNRVALDFTYYDMSTTNQILSIAVPAGTGFANRVINAGEVRNRGFEVMLSGTVVKASDFAWDLGINWSRNRNTVVELTDGIESHQLLYSISDVTIEARVGEPYGNIVGFTTLRNDEGRVVVSDQGKWQRGERAVLGNIQPDWLAGVTNTFSYKKLVLSGLIDIRKGGQVFSQTKYDQMAKGTGKFTENRENLIVDGVIDNGDGTYRENDIVILAQDYYAGGGPWGGPSESMVIDADYVALRELSLGYNFGSNLLKNTPFTNARISVVGRNLLYLHMDDEFKVMGVSPETAFSNTAAAQGHEARGIPTTKSMGFNLSLSF